jgi:predicted transcriptional regulator
VIQNDLAGAADCRKRIFDSNNLQLKQDLIEADEALNFQSGEDTGR